MYICSVCGYDALKKFPADHVICPCCGTQFGYSDEGPLAKPEMYRRLRERWVEDGATWYSRLVPPPRLWNPWSQMIRAGLFTAPWASNMVFSPAILAHPDPRWQQPPSNSGLKVSLV